MNPFFPSLGKSSNSGAPPDTSVLKSSALSKSFQPTKVKETQIKEIKGQRGRSGHSETVMIIWVSPEVLKNPEKRTTAAMSAGVPSPGRAPSPVIVPSNPELMDWSR